MNDNSAEEDNGLPKAQYRIQRTDLSWSEWRDINIPIAEQYILSLQITEYVTPEQYKEFAKQLTIGG